MMSLPIGLSTMKTPRVQDFDPNAKLPELASPLDNLPSIKPPQKKQVSSIYQELENTSRPSELPRKSVFIKLQEQTELPNGRTLERTHVRRSRRRASYELFTDQIEAIQRIALEDKLQGGTGNQSEMVRKAIDDYLKHKRGEQ